MRLHYASISVLLSSTTMQFTGSGDDEFSQKLTCDCSPKNYVPNIYDVTKSDEDDTLVPDAAGRNGVFFPGHTNTYKMTVRLPQDWPAGRHELHAVVLEGGYVASQVKNWAESEAVAACAESYADPEPYVFSVCSAAEVDVDATAPAEGEESAHASDYIRE